jgi:hypothetical protein
MCRHASFLSPFHARLAHSVSYPTAGQRHQPEVAAARNDSKGTVCLPRCVCMCVCVCVCVCSHSDLSPLLLDVLQVRDVLNRKAPRAMAAVDPIRIELVGPGADSLPPTVSVPVNAVDETAGTRDVPVCRVIYISGDDFRASPDEKGADKVRYCPAQHSCRVVRVCLTCPQGHT